MVLRAHTRGELCQWIDGGQIQVVHVQTQPRTGTQSIVEVVFGQMCKRTKALETYLLLVIRCIYARNAQGIVVAYVPHVKIVISVNDI